MKNESTGERIKRLRKEKNISVTDFANMVGTSRMQIYRYESDQIEKMPYKVLLPIAKALNVTPMYLLGMEKNNEKTPLKTCDTRSYDKELKKWIEAVGELNFSDAEFEELANYAKYIVSKRK